MSEQATLTRQQVSERYEENGLVALQTMFLQNASHELRTPLNSILGYSELLCEGYLGMLAPEQTDVITMIRDSARTLNKIVERLTLLMSTGSDALDRVGLLMGNLVEDVVADRVQDALAKDVQLDLVIEPDLPVITGDKGAVLQVIDCLIENAVKFTPAGGEINVHLYQDSGWVWFAVQDNGPGIPAQVQPYIFDRFYQADGLPTREYEGLGLGLAVVREVIQALGGKVSLYSSSGFGTCVMVQLPGNVPRVGQRCCPQSQAGSRKRAAGKPKGETPLWYIDWIPHQPC